MKKKIIIIFIVLAAISFAFYISKGSRFKKTNVFELKAGKTIDNSGNATEITNTEQNDNSDNSAGETAPNIEVKPADCDNDCANFTKDDDKEYCQEICGTTTYFENANDSGGSPEDCASEKGVQKDYCLKDIAVGNGDFKTCTQINDANIKKACQNRITEDLLEKQSGTDNSRS